MESFEYPILICYNQKNLKACVACALTSYFNMWRWANQRLLDVDAIPVTFSAAYLFYVCEKIFPSDHGYTFEQMMQVMQISSMIESSLYSFDNNMEPPPEIPENVLNVYIPLLVPLVPTKQNLINAVLNDGGFVFGLVLEKEGVSHALCAIGFDNQDGVKVVDSATMCGKPYYISWDVVCDPSITQQFYIFSPSPIVLFSSLISSPIMNQ